MSGTGKVNREPTETQSAAPSLSDDERRRRFLKNCAKFAAGTPPAVALLLSASKPAAAQAVECSTNPAPPPGLCSNFNPPGQD
jgi:hypothetical protein